MAPNICYYLQEDEPLILQHYTQAQLEHRIIDPSKLPIPIGTYCYKKHQHKGIVYRVLCYIQRYNETVAVLKIVSTGVLAWQMPVTECSPIRLRPLGTLEMLALTVFE